LFIGESIETESFEVVSEEDSDENWNTFYYLFIFHNKFNILFIQIKTLFIIIIW
jgi:hypothetical protein